MQAHSSGVARNTLPAVERVDGVDVMDRKMRDCVGAALLALVVTGAGAQTVYKCQSQGSVVYSNEPCLGAQIVDTTPTQGLDKSSGKSRKGADVSRAENSKMMADALKPLTGMDAAQLETFGRRQKLEPQVRLECARLDARLPEQTTSARTADKASVTRANVVLFESRKRYRELGC